MSIIQPTNNPSLIIDDFINYATAHLSTVSGIVTTVSIYPPVGTPGPGILPWSGYVIQPDTSAPINEVNDDLPIVEEIEVIEYEKANGTIPKEKQITPKTQSSNLSKNINVQKAADTSYILPSAIEVITEVQSEVNDISAPAPIANLDFLDDELPELPPPTIPLPTTTIPVAIQRLESGPPPQLYRKIGATPYPKPPGLDTYRNGFIDERILVPIGQSGQSWYGGRFLLHPEAARNFFKLKQQAKDDGIGFTITSAYRSIEHQTSLSSRVPGRAAKPGNSPHGWGVAIDFGELFGALDPRGTTSPVENRRVRERSPLYRWLSLNGPKYGWYNPWRLADGAGMDEIWHWEYWGFFI